MTPQDQQSPIQSIGSIEEVREQDKIQLILAYLPCLLPLIPFLTVKDSEFVKWHAKQGLVLTVGGGIIVSIVGMIPVVGLIACLAGPAMIVLEVMGIVKAMKGERWRIPLVADLADKF